MGLLIFLALQARRQQTMAEQQDAMRVQLEQFAQKNERLSNALSQAMSPQVLTGGQPADLSQLRADIAALRDELSWFRQARMAAVQDAPNRRSTNRDALHLEMARGQEAAMRIHTNFWEKTHPRSEK